DVRLEPGRQYVRVVVPPARGVGPAGQRAQRLAFLIVGHAIESQQVGDIAIFEAHPPGFEPADLRMGRPDYSSRVLKRDPLRLAKRPKLGTKQYPQNRGPADSGGDRTPVLAADRIGCSDHAPSPMKTRPRKSPMRGVETP